VPSAEIRTRPSLQQQPLTASGDQAAAELGEHGVVEARVGQLQAEQVLPVDAGYASRVGPADRVSGPTVGEVLAELEEGDQGQPRWREGGLASVKRVPS
jgi:hypothetical protein